MERYKPLFKETQHLLEAWQRKNGKWYDRIDGKIKEIDPPSDKKDTKDKKSPPNKEIKRDDEKISTYKKNLVSGAGAMALAQDNSPEKEKEFKKELISAFKKAGMSKKEIQDSLDKVEKEKENFNKIKLSMDDKIKKLRDKHYGKSLSTDSPDWAEFQNEMYKLRKEWESAGGDDKHFQKYAQSELTKR